MLIGVQESGCGIGEDGFRGSAEGLRIWALGLWGTGWGLLHSLVGLELETLHPAK